MVEMYDNHLIFGVFELIHQLVDLSKIDHVILYENNLEHMVQLKRKYYYKKKKLYYYNLIYQEENLKYSHNLDLLLKNLFRNIY